MSVQLPPSVQKALVVAAGAAITISTTAYLKSSYGKRSRDGEKDTDYYESNKLLSEYLVFHYGAPSEVLRYDFGPSDAVDFPKRCADLCIYHFNPQECKVSRALDIGCAVGRSTFELAKVFKESIGLDYSHSFVQACNDLRRDGRMSYCITDEGDLTTNLLATVDESIDRNRTTFRQGDACDLPRDLGQFGVVLAANLICRLHTPLDFFNRLADLVAPGGILVITSPYTFLREFTPRENWLGGFKDKNGAVVSGFDTMKKVLGSTFDLVEDKNMPFFIRETARKNQWTVAHATVWRRKKSS